MNPKTKEFREQIAKQFIEALQNDGLEWKKGWSGLSMCPENAINGKPYKGINNFYLRMVSVSMGLEDLRFCTYKQAQDNGWHIKAGSHGFKVEYWMPYDYENKKALSWKEYKELTREDRDKIGLRAKYYTVFNAKDIEGIPELEKPEIRKIEPDEIIGKISKNMNVEILNDGGDRAFYRPSEDKIHLPQPGYFHDEYAYNSTALHELSHATGAAHRLNRNLQNIFGSPEYAFEELVAEVSSCFMSANLSMLQSGNKFENHAAYVNSWIEAIEKSPEVLIKAIKEAERTANYLEYKAELINELEYKNTLERSITVDERVVETPTQELNNFTRNLLKAQGYNVVILDPGTEYQKYDAFISKCENSMKSLGYERSFPDSTDEKSMLMFSTGNKDCTISFDKWQEVDNFVDDVYRLVDNFSEEDINAYLKGNYDMIEYGTYNDEVVKTALQNYENLMSSREISVFYMLTDKNIAPAWEDIYNELFTHGEVVCRKYAKDIADYINSHDNLSKDIADMGNAIIKKLDSKAVAPIIEDLKENGFAPKKKLISNIEKLSEQMGRNCSLQDIHELYKSKDPLPGEAKETLRNIVNECRHQELQQIELQPEPCE